MLKPKRANIFVLMLLICSILLSVVVALVFMCIGEQYADKAETLVMMFQDVFMLLLPIMLYCIIFRTRLKDIIPHKMLSLKNIGFVVLITILMTPAISLISVVTGWIFPDDINISLINEMDKMSPFVAMFSIAFMPAVCEEMAFRGVVLSNYKSQPLLKAALVSGLFFGLFHMDFYQMLYALVAGFFFSIMVAYTNSIFASMLAHFIINGAQVIEIKFLLGVMSGAEKQRFLTVVPTMEENLIQLISAFLIFIVTFPLLFVVMRKFIRRNQENYIDYKYSLGNDSVNEFEVSIESRKTENKIVDIYFILYAVIGILLTVGLTIFQEMS